MWPPVGWTGGPNSMADTSRPGRAARSEAQIVFLCVTSWAHGPGGNSIAIQSRPPAHPSGSARLGNVKDPATESQRPAAPATSESLVGLIARGVLDAEVAALIWVLVEARIPIVVAAPAGRIGAGGQLLGAILGSIHPDENLEPLMHPMGAAGAGSLVRGRRAGGVVEAASLGDVRQKLGGGPLPLTDDQLTFLGCVLVIGDVGGDERRAGRLRVTAAHYVRPLARDAHGHPQRLEPAVLATWDERLGKYEHFAWGVLPEIAARLQRRTGDLEADLHHRRDDLAGLAKAGVTSIDEVRKLVAGYRAGWGTGHGAHDDGASETGHKPH